MIGVDLIYYGDMRSSEVMQYVREYLWNTFEGKEIFFTVVFSGEEVDMSAFMSVMTVNGNYAVFVEDLQE